MIDYIQIMNQTLDFGKFDAWFKKTHNSHTDLFVGSAGITAGEGDFEFDTEGTPHVVMGFPQVIGYDQMMAFSTRAPHRVRWWKEGRQVAAEWLGFENVAHVMAYRNKPLYVHDSPLAWLISGCKGAWPVDDAAIEDLRVLRNIECSQMMADRIKSVLCRMPRIEVR